ncbi:MAG: HD domain-containing protein [Planctomycetota bacterium]|nr:HD domain-containing protein [Planctomycetota bacterium]
MPDYVLLKPGRLDDREFEIMKTHAQAGADTLNKALGKHPAAEFLRMARDIAGCHHERYDGHGYPAGLAGEAIPLAARLFALADVYDALVSKRVYKAAFTHDVARGIILEKPGTQFDPDVVEAFLQCEQDFRKFGQELADERAA